MATMMTDEVLAVKYECELCEVKGLTRVDWLVHLILPSHNDKAREHLQQLYFQSNGNLFVISGIGQVENSRVLNYVASKVPGLYNWVCFKPDADFCIMVCNERDFQLLSATPHQIDGNQLKFKDYKEISPNEWKSYFHKPPPVSEDIKSSLSAISSASSSSDNNSMTPQKKRQSTFDPETDDNPSTKTKKQKRLAYQFEKVSSAKTKSDIETIAELDEFLLMPETDKSIRVYVTSELKFRFRSVFPECELISVGPDFLGFNIGNKDEFKLFLDINGMINPGRPNSIRTIQEDDSDLIKDSIRKVFRILLETENELCVKDIIIPQTNDSTFKFVFILSQQTSLKCTLLLKPFKLAHSALLCKTLYFSNLQSTLLCKLAVYWVIKQSFAEVGLDYPFLIYWIVFMYLIKKKVLKPIISLQNDCNYLIMDQEMNVAFKYEKDILQKLATQTNPADLADADFNLKTELENWIIYVISTFVKEKTDNYQNVICPRYGTHFDKTYLKICKLESLLQNHPNQISKTSDKDRKTWSEGLVKAGFDQDSWKLMGKLKFRATLTIQHPFYLSEDIGAAITAKIFKMFLHLIRYTKEHLTQKQIVLKHERCILKAMACKPGNIHLYFPLASETEGGEGPGQSQGQKDKGKVSKSLKFAEVNSSTLNIWRSEINIMKEAVLLSQIEVNVRLKVIQGLKSILKPDYPNCELIPVGIDFLGFGVAKQVLNLYFDESGTTKPGYSGEVRKISETLQESLDLQNCVLSILKNFNSSRSKISPFSLTNVTANNVKTGETVWNFGNTYTSVDFNYVANNVGQLTCKIFIRPIRLAQTALLCKHLLLLNRNVLNLTTLIIYWANQPSFSNFSQVFLHNPFVLLWLIYIFFMKKNILPNVSELQKLCDYQIINADDYQNVTFYYDLKIIEPNMISKLDLSISTPTSSEKEIKSIVELLMEWFTFMESLVSIDESSDSDRTKEDKHNSVICPRIGKLVNKFGFRKCKPQSPDKDSSNDYMLSLGWDISLLEICRKIGLDKSWIVQDPLYLNNNLAQCITKAESKSFTSAIKCGKKKLQKMVELVRSNSSANVSLVQSLSPNM